MPSPKMKRLNKLHKIARANRNSAPATKEAAPAPVAEEVTLPDPDITGEDTAPVAKPAAKTAAKPAKKATRAKKATKTVKTND